MSLIKSVRFHHLPIRFLLVNNGSTDKTGQILKRMQKKFNEVKIITISQNLGYGYGIRMGLAQCKTAYLGFMCGDGQTDPEDVVRVVKVLKSGPQFDAAKVVRKMRHDNLKRRAVSLIYNWIFSSLFLFPARDVNGTPKIFRREVYQKCQLVSNDWFIDAEFMLKIRLYGFHLKEIPTRFFERKAGISSVNLSTILEFIINIIIYRLKYTRKFVGRELRLSII